MSKTKLEDTGGWTPVIESLCEHYDIATALVFGVVWRYCNMHHGICDAALDTIAHTARVSRSTAKRKLKILIEHGFIVDMTQSERHRPHYYQDTGKAGIHMLAYNSDDFIQQDKDTEVGQNEPLKQDKGQIEPYKGQDEPQLHIEEKEREIPPTPKKPRTAEEIRQGNLQALVHGTQNTLDIRATVERRFHINPNWQSKNWNNLLLFIKERPKGQTLDRFADWWYAEDWRGKQGAPPTCGNIYELWPQAFKDGGETGMRINPDGSFN